ncbi:hypothetical protein D3C72_2092810 [compost metagenome]
MRTEPLDQQAEAHDEVAFVAKALRCQEAGRAHRTLLAKEQELVARDRLTQGRARGAPVGQ